MQLSSLYSIVFNSDEKSIVPVGYREKSAIIWYNNVPNEILKSEIAAIKLWVNMKGMNDTRHSSPAEYTV